MWVRPKLGRSWWALVLLSSAPAWLGCQPDSILHAPARSTATVVLAYSTGKADHLVQPDAVRLRIVRGAVVVIDSTIAFPATENELRVRLPVPLTQSVDTFDIAVDLIENGALVKSGGETIVLKMGAVTTAVIDESSLFDPSPVLRASAIDAFTLAVSGGDSQDGHVLLDGLLTDEWVHSGTFPTRNEIDRRAISTTNLTLATAYRNLHRARLSLEFAAQRTALETPGDPAFAEMLALAGFTYLFFAEGYCSGVGFTRIDAFGRVSPGSALTTQQMRDTAISRFQAALSAPGSGSGQIALLAMAGIARAHLVVGPDRNALFLYAQQIPTDFQYLLQHSSSPAQKSNAIHVLNNLQKRYSLADGEGAVGLRFRSANDPRVLWRGVGGLGFDFFTPHFDLLKYPDRAAPLVLASGTEARLIEAEAYLVGGDIFNTLARLNTIRSAAGLPPLVPPPSLAEVVDVVAMERAFWLFATGHRIGDLRRWSAYAQGGLPLTNALSFPIGPYHKGGTYGVDVSLPIPVERETNPDGLVCLDRDS